MQFMLDEAVANGEIEGLAGASTSEIADVGGPDSPAQAPVAVGPALPSVVVPSDVPSSAPIVAADSPDGDLADDNGDGDSNGDGDGNGDGGSNGDGDNNGDGDDSGDGNDNGDRGDNGDGGVSAAVVDRSVNANASSNIPPGAKLGIAAATLTLLAVVALYAVQRRRSGTFQDGELVKHRQFNDGVIDDLDDLGTDDGDAEEDTRAPKGFPSGEANTTLSTAPYNPDNSQDAVNSSGSVLGEAFLDSNSRNASFEQSTTHDELQSLAYIVNERDDQSRDDSYFRRVAAIENDNVEAEYGGGLSSSNGGHSPGVSFISMSAQPISYSPSSDSRSYQADNTVFL
jgi:hypothetical protein